MSEFPEEQLDVAIVGAGLSGLALARFLTVQRPQLRIRVFERDSALDERSQGYALTIQQAERIMYEKLQICNKKLQQHVQSSTAHYMLHPDGKVISAYGVGLYEQQDSSISQNPQPEGKPLNKKARAKLSKGVNILLPREALRRSLAPDRLTLLRDPASEEAIDYDIAWSHRFLEYAEQSDGSLLVSFAKHQEGSEAECAKPECTVIIRCKLLVGCDGVFSRVKEHLLQRSLALPPQPLGYLGVVVILGMCPSEGRNHFLFRKTTWQTVGTGPESDAEAERSSQEHDPSTRLYVMPFTATTTFWQLSFAAPLAQAEKLRNLSMADVKGHILHDRGLASWHDPVAELIEGAEEQSMSLKLIFDAGQAFPFLGHTWKRCGSCGGDYKRQHAEDANAPDPSATMLPVELQKKEGVEGCRLPVTLLGDAAHAMTPFKGQGANQALLDAVELGEVVVKHGIDELKPTHLRTFEAAMYSRVERKVQESRRVAFRLHGYEDEVLRATPPVGSADPAQTPVQSPPVEAPAQTSRSHLSSGAWCWTDSTPLSLHPDEAARSRMQHALRGMEGLQTMFEAAALNVTDGQERLVSCLREIYRAEKERVKTASN